jgi:hypothetical protein
MSSVRTTAPTATTSSLSWPHHRSRYLPSGMSMYIFETRCVGVAIPTWSGAHVWIVSRWKSCGGESSRMNPKGTEKPMASRSRYDPYGLDFPHRHHFWTSYDGEGRSVFIHLLDKVCNCIADAQKPETMTVCPCHDCTQLYVDWRVAQKDAREAP